MSVPDRPEGVPPEAVWVEKDKEWQLGETRRRGRGRSNTFPVGEQRAFRRDGSLLAIAHFDDEGNLHGTNERFHPDGSLASRGEWVHGNRSGHFVFIQTHGETREGYPTNGATWRYEFDSFANWSEENERWFLEDGRECTFDGRPLEFAYDLDRVIADAGPEGYLERHATAVAAAFGKDASAAEVSPDPFGLADLWGTAVPEIDRFLALAIEGDDFSRATTCRRFEGNAWDALIAHPWENQLEELGAVFLGAVRIGRIGDSDGVYATLFQPRREKPGPNAVYLWSHDTYYVDEVLALSLDAFAYRTAVAGAFAAQRLSARAAASAWRRLAGQVRVSWGAAAGLETLDAGEEDDAIDREAFETELDPGNAILGLFWRAQWILHLLRADDERDWSTVRDCFRPGWNRPFDEAEHEKRVQHGLRLPQVAMYLLWRSFWFDQADRLERCRAAFRSHPARLVRDLVLLLDELLAGRRRIGGIEDVFEVRRRFLALDLLPERAGERARESAVAATREEERLTAVAAAVGEDGTPPSIESVLDLAWASVGDAPGLAVIECAARSLPGLGPQWRAIDWVRKRGFERGNTTCQEEAEGVGLWLGASGGPALLPFVWADRATAGLLPGMVRSEEGRDPRLAAVCLAALDVVEEYNHRRTLAVQLLTAMGEGPALSRVAALVDEYQAVIAGKRDFDQRLAVIPWNELLRSTAEALGRLARKRDASATRKLRWLLTHALGNSDWDLSSVALEALLALGETRLLTDIRRLLSANDDSGRHAALLAVEKLAATFEAGERAEFVEGVFRNPAEQDNAVTLLYYRAARALAQADPTLPLEVLTPKEALEAASELTNYGSDGWRLWRLVECETVGLFPELDLSILDRHLRSSDRRVREAAEAAYASRGVAPPERRILSWPVIWEALEGTGSPEEATPAVTRLLLDKASVDRAPAAGWLWENPSPAGAAALSTVVDGELDAFLAPGPGDNLETELHWLIRALLRHGAFEESTSAIERCLAFANDEVARTVNAELDSLPARFAPAVLGLTREHTDFRRGSAARWALARKDEPAVVAALEAAGIPARKLRAWSR